MHGDISTTIPGIGVGMLKPGKSIVGLPFGRSSDERPTSTVKLLDDFNSKSIIVLVRLL